MVKSSILITSRYGVKLSEKSRITIDYSILMVAILFKCNIKHTLNSKTISVKLKALFMVE